MNMNRPAATTVDRGKDVAPTERGTQAYRDGLPWEANPYDVESDDAFCWQDGWREAERETERRKKRAGDFAKALREGHFRSAMAGVVGDASKALALSKELLLEFNRTSPELQSPLLAWCESPLEQVPITDQRWLVEALARHEMGHIVAARAFGFQFSGVTLVLRDRNGNHEGAASLNLDLAAPSLENIVDYIDRRIMILLAGGMSEPEKLSDRKWLARDPYSNSHAESDLQKADELLQLRMNIEGKTRADAHRASLGNLCRLTFDFVNRNYSVIDALAKRFAEQMTFYEEKISWTRDQIEAQPEISQICASST